MSHIYSRKHKVALAKLGHNGKPIFTPSVCI